MAHLLGQAIFGLIVGAIAKLLLPGRDPGGILITMGIGLVGSMLGTLLGRAIKGDNYQAHWVMSIAGAIVLLVVFRWWVSGLA
ncbi:MAG: GlsB/YeaQ/YmgE family stress response membrane protein [Candidatus Rokuibacteriota bacterium]|nr:MAG: GlsB/YeaQ/YmgE family stress response membrane protein [Candidatus Rokubacteria bacterium]